MFIVTFLEEAVSDIWVACWGCNQMWYELVCREIVQMFFCDCFVGFSM